MLEFSPRGLCGHLREDTTHGRSGIPEAEKWPTMRKIAVNLAARIPESMPLDPQEILER
jgi:hypothetical protein